MFRVIYTLYLLVIIYTCHGQNPVDTSNCGNTYSPVMGENKLCYLNPCWAAKANIMVKNNSEWNKKFYKKSNPYTWNIVQVCTPIKSHEIIKDLKDGTFVYKHAETGKLFRGNRNNCRCLLPESMIWTINGYQEVEKLKTGDKILTINNNDTVFLPIIEINKVKSDMKDHYISHITFSDGSKIAISSSHPTADYKKDLNYLKKGDFLDGKEIIQIDKILFTGDYTFDILPKGSTGNYWVNGIRLGSTLFGKNVSIYSESSSK